MYGPGIVKQYQHKPPNAGSQKPALADLPMNLLQMFEPRLDIPHKKAIVKPPIKHCYTGISKYVSLFETTKPPELPVFIPPKELKLKHKEHLLNLNKERNDLVASEWNPHQNPKATENPYFTLFVGRLSYDITEKKLRREFEQFGTIKKIVIVNDLTDKPKGYAFIEFEKEEHMMLAYKRADGKKIDGRRIVVDVERGRTVRNWRPTRLGGGKGGRIAIKSKKQLEEAAASAAAEAEKARSATIYGGGGISSGSTSDRNRGSSRDRGSDRPRGNSRDRERPRGASRDRGSDRPREVTRDRGSERGASDRDRGSERGASDRDRGSERGASDRDRGSDRGISDRDRGSDRGIASDRDRGASDRDRGSDRGTSDRDRGSERDRPRERSRSRDRERGIIASSNNNRTAGLGYR